jgi:surface polysaccharide O-acyltransferase-like enzyme
LRQEEVEAHPAGLRASSATYLKRRRASTGQGVLHVQTVAPVITWFIAVLFRQHWNRQGRLAKGLAASAFTVYLIHPLVIVSFASAFSTVALYPLLKCGIAVLITIPLCFLISLLIRKIPLVNRVL